jgi:hypothetical protein
MTEKKFKKGERVKWFIGRAEQPSRGTVNRFLKAGTKIPNVRGAEFVSQTFAVGDVVGRDKVLINAKDGTVRVLAPGYLERY